MSKWVERFTVALAIVFFVVVAISFAIEIKEELDGEYKAERKTVYVIQFFDAETEEDPYFVMTSDSSIYKIASVADTKPTNLHFDFPNVVGELYCFTIKDGEVLGSEMGGCK